MRGRIGAMLNKEEYVEAITEAKTRANSKTPPGYKDSGKDPVASAGDYLVWLQTIRYAKLKKRDVLFVTGDIKEDWWRREHGELRGPRPELVEEMKDQASVRLFILRPESLLLQARKALQINVHDESVQDIERVDQLSATLAYSASADAARIRERWDDVLESVKKKRKVAWILLDTATVTDFDGVKLTLEFNNEGYAKGFQASGYSSTLQDALEETCDIRPEILAAARTGAVFDENITHSDRRKIMTEGHPGHGNPSPLAPGDKVCHDSYGFGTVLTCEGTSDDPEAKIDFGDQIGIKHLVLRYAPIQKI